MMMMTMMMATHRAERAKAANAPHNLHNVVNFLLKVIKVPKMAAITILLQHARLEEVLPGVTADDITRFNIFSFTIDYRH